MFSPRWRKMVRDIWLNKTRILLVVLSIATGVFAIGAIAGARSILTEGMAQSYQSVRPATAMIYTTDPFDDTVLDAIRNLDEVKVATGRFIFSARLRVGENEWKNLQLFALKDYDEIPIHEVRSVTGAWPPPKRAILIERDTLNLIDVAVGQQLQIETPTGNSRTLEISGIAHEMPLFPSKLAGIAYGYITYDTLAWLGAPRLYNELLFVANDQTDDAAIQHAISRVQDRLEGNQIRVRTMFVPITPNRHDAQDIIAALVIVLGVLGLLLLFLSSFLVINTMTALLTQQTRQIGVMKTIGAQPHQLITMYLSLALCSGLAATVIALPFSVTAARALAEFALTSVNFTVTDFSVPWQIYALQIAVGLFLPLLAALYPVLAGTRLTVREALTASGGAEAGQMAAHVDRLLQALPTVLLLRLSRPQMLSLRNTFRRTGRMALTLSTLTLGSAIFIAVFSVRASAVRTFQETARYWGYDVEITLSRPYPIARLEQTALQVPTVAQVEAWGMYSTRRLRADGTESTAISLLAPPSNSELVSPVLVAGRWLLPGDENALVVDTDLLKREPDLSVGDEVVLKIDGRDLPLYIVGIVKGQYRGFPVAYVNYSYFSTTAVRKYERAQRVVAVAEEHDPEFQSQVANALEATFKARGLDLTLTETVTEIRSRVEEQFNIVIVFLLIMAMLMSVVGGCGLAGTMSINVLERTREIGIMRAIGATDKAVKGIILFEGLLIGLLSWFAGSLLAAPLGKLLSDAVGQAMAKATLSYTFPVSGLVIWLIAVLLLSVVATYLPAWNASRLSVRETLAHE